MSKRLANWMERMRSPAQVRGGARTEVMRRLALARGARRERVAEIARVVARYRARPSNEDGADAAEMTRLARIRQDLDELEAFVDSKGVAAGPWSGRHARQVYVDEIVEWLEGVRWLVRENAEHVGKPASERIEADVVRIMHALRGGFRTPYQP